jgi:NitT/TauT family transport system substrate-binding protein
MVAGPAILRAAEVLSIGFVPANALHWIGCVLLEKGFLKQAGYDPQLSVFQSAPQAMQQLIAGAYQVSSTQPDPLIAAIERGATGIGGFTAPANRADWLLNAQPEIKTLQDLKGKVIGVSALRSSEVWLTQQLLEKAGLKKGDYDFLVAGLSPAKVSALQSKAVAASVLFQPSAEVAARLGFPAVARYSGLRAFPAVLYTMAKDWAGKNQNGTRVSQAFQQGHTWLQDRNNQAEAIAIFAKYSKREPEVVAKIYNQFFVDEDVYSKHGEINMEGFANVVADMAADGEVIKGAPPPATKYVLPKELGGITA